MTAELRPSIETSEASDAQDVPALPEISYESITVPPTDEGCLAFAEDFVSRMHPGLKLRGALEKVLELAKAQLATSGQDPAANPAASQQPEGESR